MVVRKLILAAERPGGRYSALWRRREAVVGTTDVSSSSRSFSDATVKVFDRAAKRQQRDRAAATDPDGEYDYLREHIASALVDRLEV